MVREYDHGRVLRTRPITGNQERAAADIRRLHFVGTLPQFDDAPSALRWQRRELAGRLRCCPGARRGRGGSEAPALDAVTLQDLQRYMGVLGAEVRMPFGEPWRADKQPYGKTTLSTTASVLKMFYVGVSAQGRNAELARQLDQTRLPTRTDRNRALLGHVKTTMPANPLAPRSRPRRHPKMLPDDARSALLAAANTARDRMVITWFYDGGFRVGELCGLHLADLHLRDNAECAECRSPHAHICHRDDNPNAARAKSKHPWELANGVVHGGLVRRVSPAMIHAYFGYMTTEYPRSAATGHGMLLVQLAGDEIGQPWAPAGVRGMFRRAGTRAGLGRIRPHQARHTFATAVLDASNGNLLIARDAGGWASAATVEEIYGHVDIHDPTFNAALNRVWGEQS